MLLINAQYTYFNVMITITNLIETIYFNLIYWTYKCIIQVYVHMVDSERAEASKALSPWPYYICDNKCSAMSTVDQVMLLSPDNASLVSALAPTQICHTPLLGTLLVP